MLNVLLNEVKKNLLVLYKGYLKIGIICATIDFFNLSCNILLFNINQPTIKYDKDLSMPHG